MLVDRVGERFRHFRVFLGSKLLAQVSRNFAAHFIECLDVLWLERGDGQDVEAEIGSDDIADFALLELAYRAQQWCWQAILANHAQVAALFGGGRVFRLGFRHSGKAGRRFAHVSQDGFSLGLGGCLVGGRGVFLDGYQDVAGLVTSASVTSTCSPAALSSSTTYSIFACSGISKNLLFLS